MGVSSIETSMKNPYLVPASMLRVYSCFSCMFARVSPSSLRRRIEAEGIPAEMSHEMAASPDISTGYTWYSQVMLWEGDIRLVESLLRSTGVEG